MPCVDAHAWRDAGGFFDWRGLRIYHRAEGAGEVVLLVHGFPTSSWDWHHQWPDLARTHRVLALDLVGFGFSAKPSVFDYQITSQADLIEALLAREGVTRYHLVAHDYGVTIAQELLARRAPLLSVCLLNGGLFPETHRPLPMQKLLASPVGPVVARLASYRTFRSSFRRICARPLDEAELRTMWGLCKAGGGRAVMPRILGYMEQRRRHRDRWVGALTGTDIRLRLINGLEDPISGAHMAARYRELVPTPDVVELPGVGHYPQLEAPDDVLAAIRAHL
jgi:pimeloyl-ACP methyl ester carboxylesterase